MNEQWIRANLKPLLSPDGQFLILEDLGHGKIVISVADMVNLFSSVTDPTYENLSATPQASQGGWQQYFDDWKVRGWIS